MMLTCRIFYKPNCLLLNFGCALSTSTSSFILSHEKFASRSNAKFHQPKLIILHSLIGSKANWRSIARNLSQKGRDVFTVDLRNHGDSPHSDELTYDLMVADLLKTIESFSVAGPFDLMGHSVGGKVAMLTALLHPDLVSRLVVADILPSRVPSAGSPFVKMILKVVPSINLDLKATSIAGARKAVFKQLTTKIQDRKVCDWLATNVEYSEEKGTYWKCNFTAIGNAIDEVISFPEITCFKQFKKPVLFIEGENSKHMKVPDREEVIMKFFANFTLSVLNESGHWVHADKPYNFLKLVNTFLSTKIS